MGLEVRWLGRIAYREAWALQHDQVAARAAGRIGDQLLLVEHPPVLTLGRHSDEAHIRATPEELRRRGIEVVRVERGGEVTYHGPGQLVAYPIVQLAQRAPCGRAPGARPARRAGLVARRLCASRRLFVLLAIVGHLSEVSRGPNCGAAV